MELLSSMIGDIYDAALDPALWPAVLEKSCRFVGSGGAGLYSKDSVGKTAEISYGFGVEPEYRQSYVDTYVGLDPTTTGYFFFGVGEVAATADIIPYEEFVETRFYKEWVRPQGWVDVATSLLEKSVTSYSLLTFFRRDRTDELVRQRVRLLAPHFRRAVLIGRTLELETLEAATLADALDGLAAGVFLVGGQGHLVHANEAGHVMLGEEAVFRAAGGRLIANDPGVDQSLRGTFAAAAAGDGGLGARGIALPLTAHGQHYVAHVLPLTSSARSKAGASYAAAAAVFVRKAGLDAPAAPEVIARLYGLTPSELRVLLAVFESGGVTNVAEALGISEATAKTHLRRLFEKTGTQRQADLVKLVAGFAAPAG